MILSAVFILLPWISIFVRGRTFEKEKAESYSSSQHNKKVIYFWSENFQENEEEHSDDAFQGFLPANTVNWQLSKETWIPTEYSTFFNRRLKARLLFLLFRNLRL